MFIIKYLLGLSAVTVPSFIKDIVSERNDSIDINIRQNARIKYLEDATICHKNELTRVIQSMHGDQRLAKHEQAVSTAQYNEWKAATELVNFTTEKTTCEPQPRFNNFTICRSGLELIAFTLCYWAGGIGNLNDKPQAYRNNALQPVEVSVVMPESDLADLFR
ncbi:hypothetical protein OUZ56_032699 [Daphnia magna]|uniref:Uncharacterized protein n=1 Tax=Daphnia magna TaxID=35525 RepID=A0ABQ9ZWV6_9CRUS|nr:hypothetical protein OUZ56_032699 [Daphnia magna]